MASSESNVTSITSVLPTVITVGLTGFTDEPEIITYYSSATPTSTTTTFRTITASPTTVDTGTATDGTTATSGSNGTTDHNLSSGAKAGIGAAAAIGGLLVLALVGYVSWRIRRGDRVGLSISIWKKHGEEEETDLAPAKLRQSTSSSRPEKTMPRTPQSPVELPLAPIPVPELFGSVPLEVSREKEVVHEMQGH